MLRNFYVTVYVPDYVTVIRVLGSGTNEGSSPRSGRGRPPSLVPTWVVLSLVGYLCRAGSTKGLTFNIIFGLVVGGGAVAHLTSRQ